MNKLKLLLPALLLLSACSRQSLPSQPQEDAPPGSSEIALDLKDNLSEADIKQLAADYSIAIRDDSPESRNLGNIEVATVPTEKQATLIERLSRDPRVEVAEPAMMAYALYTPNDPMFKDQWGLSKIGMESAWGYSCGQGVTVAVVDTGITAEDSNGYKIVSDLKDATFVPGYNFITPKAPPHDDQGHGTHCAGTVAQSTNNNHGASGVAPCVRLMPVKVLSSSGSGSMSGVAEGIRWAADHGAQVISLSLGSSSNSDIVAKAVTYAHDKGVFLSCAAGNSGGSVGYPAANKGCVAVSATDSQDNLASFSSRGKEVAIGAPGVGILQQTISEGGRGTGSFEKFNGTSMATPHVSGAAALLYAQGVTDPDAILHQLQTNAVDKQDRAKFGAGILNASDATRNTSLRSNITRLLSLGILSFILLTIFKKHKIIIDPHPAKFVGALLGSVGILFFLPMTGLLPYLGSFRWLGDLLSHPLPEWDLVIQNSLHKWMFLASAFPAFGLVAIGYQNRILRSLAGGLALGTAAYLLATVFSGTTLFVLGPFAMKIWSIANIIALLWVSKNTLFARKEVT